MQKHWALFLWMMKLDFKSQQTIMGVLVFGLSSIYAAFLLNGEIQDGAFLLSYWSIAALFAGVHSIQKDQFNAHNGSGSLYYQLTSPRMFATVKSIYNGLFLAVLFLFQWLMLLFYFGSDWTEIPNVFTLLLAICLIGMAMGISLSFVSGIAQKTNQPGGITAILSFAVLIPVLYAAVALMKREALADPGQQAQWGWLLIIMMNLLPFGLSNLLYPYLWRD
jgi:ABC-type transport system involved in cytochrome c biogenesis permease component